MYWIYVCGRCATTRAMAWLNDNLWEFALFLCHVSPRVKCRPSSWWHCPSEITLQVFFAYFLRIYQTFPPFCFINFSLHFISCEREVWVCAIVQVWKVRGLHVGVSPLFYHTDAAAWTQIVRLGSWHLHHYPTHWVILTTSILHFC